MKIQGLVAMMFLTLSGSALAEAVTPTLDYWNRRFAEPVQDTGQPSVTIEEALDNVVPSDSCWQIRIEEPLRGKPVRLPKQGTSWRDQLEKLAKDGQFGVGQDTEKCLLYVVEGPPYGVAQLPATQLAMDYGRAQGQPPILATERPPSHGITGDGAPLSATPGLPDQGGSEDTLAIKPSGDRAVVNMVSRAYTARELLNESVGLHMKQATFRDLFSAIFPSDWDIQLDMTDKLKDALVDFTYEGRRGYALEKLSRNFRLDILPYPKLGVVVVREMK